MEAYFSNFILFTSLFTHNIGVVLQTHPLGIECTCDAHEHTRIFPSSAYTQTHTRQINSHIFAGVDLSKNNTYTRSLFSIGPYNGRVIDFHFLAVCARTSFREYRIVASSVYICALLAVYGTCRSPPHFHNENHKNVIKKKKMRIFTPLDHEIHYEEWCACMSFHHFISYHFKQTGYRD